MSKFKTLCQEYRDCGLITNAQLTLYTKKYDLAKEENQLAYDKHCEMLLSTKIRDVVIAKHQIEKIHSNLKFYTWLIIINLAIGVIALVIINS